MADERDPKVSQRYQELGTEEPPRSIDEAILAASRRAEVHAAPLVPPTGRRRWYFPVAAAAVIVLAVAVTVHVERDRPDPESAVLAQAPEAAAEARKEEKAAQAAAQKPFAADPPQESRNQAMRDAPARAAPKPQVAPPVAASRMEERARESAPVAGARAPEAARADRALGKISEATTEPPEKWLERIAALRKEGKHEEADKALEAFRKRYPDYEVPKAALKK